MQLLIKELQTTEKPQMGQVVQKKVEIGNRVSVYRHFKGVATRVFLFMSRLAFMMKC